MSENKALNKVTHTPSYLEWFRVEELGYEEGPSSSSSTERVCFACAKPLAPPFHKCSKCKVAAYCQRDCQIKDWKTQHKGACASFHRVGPEGRGLRDDTDTAAARQEVFHRIRFYACAYAVWKHGTLGRGFLFLQSQHSLAALSIHIPKDVYGRPLSTIRGVMVHYLTTGEYDAEVCRDDFELAAMRADLLRAVEEYDPEQQVVLLMRFRCGHVAVGRTQLSMPYGSFLKLGQDFFAEQNADCVQLNIDDV